MFSRFSPWSELWERTARRNRVQAVQSRLGCAFDRLEDRRLLATDILLSSVSSITSYAGVGFTNNVVGEFAAYVNNTPDRNPAHYTAQVDFGDGGGFQAAKVVLKGTQSSHPFLVKSSHVYADFGQTYDVIVKVTGQGGTGERQTTTIFTQQMPSGLDGAKPPATASGGKDVDVLLSSVSSVTTYAGVGFELNEVAELAGYLNGAANKAKGDYKAFVNWGDSSAWTTAQIAEDLGNTSTPLIVKGSHVYAQPGEYPVVVYAQGPDGTSTVRHSTSFFVSFMPSGLPGTRPAQQPRSLPPSEVDLNLSSVSSYQAYKNVTIVDRVVGEFDGYLNDVRQTDEGKFHAQINWGDTSAWSTATIENDNSGGSVVFQVLGSHKYTEVGQYDVVIYVNGPDGTSLARLTTSIFVGLSDTPLLVGSVTTSVEQGAEVPSPLATFNSDDSSIPPFDLRAIVNWGDGSPNEGAPIRLRGGTIYEVESPGHTYGTPGRYTSAVVVHDGQGNSSRVENTYTVAPHKADLTLAVQHQRIVPVRATDLNLNFVFGNERVNIPVVIRNAGSTRATGNANVAIFLTTAPNIDGPRTLLINKSIAIDIPPGASRAYTIAATIPTSLATGAKYYFIGRIVSTSVDEFTAANNTSNTGRTFEFLGTPSSNPAVFSGTIFFDFVRRAIKNTPNIPSTVDRSDMTQFIGHFEGAHQEPYIDTENHPSIGIGINLDSVSGALKANLAAAARRYYLATYNETLSTNDTTVINILKAEARAHSGKKAISVADMRALFAQALPAYEAKARNTLGAATYDALNAYQQVALVSMTYNLGSLVDFPSMVNAFKNGELLQAGFQLVDAIRTTQAPGLTRRTGVEFANFFEGREQLLGRIVS